MTFRLMSEEFLGPLCSRLQAVMLMELDVAASTCSRAVVNQNLRRLELEMLYPLEVPCCLELRSLDAIDEPEAFTYVSGTHINSLLQSCGSTSSMMQPTALFVWVDLGAPMMPLLNGMLGKSIALQLQRF